MKAIVAERGQVTIPVALRKKLGLKPGTVLDFHVEKAKLIAIKIQEEDPIDKVSGCIDLGMSTDEYMRELRGDVE